MSGPRCLRPDLPAPYAFSVSARPCAAKLDQNEAPVALPAALRRSILDELDGQAWNRYVQPADYISAKSGLSAVFGLDANMVALTVGADQGLEAAFMIAGGPGRRARWFEPTYPYIAHAARRTATATTAVSLGEEIDSDLNVATIEDDDSDDLLFLVSPNNPTGGLVQSVVIDAALVRAERLVVIDEAYADFAEHSEIARVGDAANLLVVRSLSKACLAGVHLGFVVGHPTLIAAVERMYTAPYHLNALQLLIARRYADIAPHVRSASAAVIAERRRLHHELCSMSGVKPSSSCGNFVLFCVVGERQRAADVHQDLERAGVRIRDLSRLPSLSSNQGGYLRVTVGSPDENDLFLSTLAEALRGAGL